MDARSGVRLGMGVKVGAASKMSERFMSHQDIKFQRSPFHLPKKLFHGINTAGLLQPLPLYLLTHSLMISWQTPYSGAKSALLL